MERNLLDASRPPSSPLETTRPVAWFLSSNNPARDGRAADFTNARTIFRAETRCRLAINADRGPSLRAAEIAGRTGAGSMIGCSCVPQRTEKRIAATESKTHAARFC